jgi:hypothetical protein
MATMWLHHPADCGIGQPGWPENSVKKIEIEKGGIGRGTGGKSEILSSPRKTEHCLAGLERTGTRLRSGGFFGQPVAQLQVLFDLSALVPVFMGLFGAVIGFAEGMFGTSYGLGNHVQCFSHV